MFFIESLLIIAPLVLISVLLAFVFDVFDYFSYIFAVMCFVVGIAFLWIQAHLVPIVLFSGGALGLLTTEAYKRFKDH